MDRIPPNKEDEDKIDYDRKTKKVTQAKIENHKKQNMILFPQEKFDVNTRKTMLQKQSDYETKYDEFGDYKDLPYPMSNYNFDGHTPIPHLKPLFQNAVNNMEYDFAKEMATLRENYEFLWRGTLAVTLSSLAALKSVYVRKYCFMPLTALWFYTFYYRDLAHGNMVHRVQLEAHRVLTEESATYFKRRDAFMEKLYLFDEAKDNEHSDDDHERSNSENEQEQSQSQKQ